MLLIRESGELYAEASVYLEHAMAGQNRSARCCRLARSLHLCNTSQDKDQQEKK
jgi:hypothetical protein